MAENMLKGFSDGSSWSDGSIWSNPNFQSLLAGLGSSIDQRNGKKGMGGQVGEMFQGYIQSVEAQKAMEKQMKQKSLWAQIMAKALGLGGQGQTQAGPQDVAPLMPQADMSSDQWLTGLQQRMMGGQ